MRNGQPSESATVHGLIEGHVRRAKTLRQIQSNKASDAKSKNTAYVIVTIVIATIVSVAGFGGVGQISSMISDTGAAPVVNFIYSMFVLSILIVTLIGIVLRYDERANRHYRSVEILTEFIRDWEDALALSQAPGHNMSAAQLTEARLRYKGIIMSLPPNTDKEYTRAKNNAKAKRSQLEAAGSGDEGSDDMPQISSIANIDRSGDETLSTQLKSILTRDNFKSKVFKLVESELGSGAWITGGFVRNAVWDKLHGHELPTFVDDIDIVYFDPSDLSEDSERAMAKRLCLRAPNINWSVKNQARMHVAAGTEPYVSLEDAVSRFPETATAVAVQIHKGALRILAPLGLKDLFGLSLRENVLSNDGAFSRRMAEKKWTEYWPRLVVEAE
jgi:hypothetical protein